MYDVGIISTIWGPLRTEDHGLYRDGRPEWVGDTMDLAVAVGTGGKPEKRGWVINWMNGYVDS